MQSITENFAKSIKSFTYRYEDQEEKISASEIRKWFLEEFSDDSLQEREAKIRQRIKDRLSNLVVRDLSAKKSVRLYTQQETEAMLAKYFNEWLDFNKLFHADIMQWYINTLISSGEVAAALENAQTQVSENVSSWGKYFSLFTQNDLAAIFYIYQRIVGSNKNPYKLIIIDEAQMLSPLWLAGLRSMLADDGTFLLAGDLNQKPAVVDLPEWDSYKDFIADVEIMELNKCYRLTDNIGKYALDVLMKHPSLYQFETAGRIGEEVQVIDGSESERIIKVTREVPALLQKYDSVAIVGRTLSQCEELYQQLVPRLPGVKLITENDDLTKINIVPVNIIGGLEFDIVVIFNHKNYNLEDIFEAQQLYLGVTRAVHKLVLA